MPPSLDAQILAELQFISRWLVDYQKSQGICFHEWEAKETRWLRYRQCTKCGMETDAAIT